MARCSASIDGGKLHTMGFDRGLPSPFGLWRDSLRYERACLPSRSKSVYVEPVRRRPSGFGGTAFATRGLAQPKQAQPAKAGGARRDRTADLLHAMQALSQLSYGPLT